MTTLRELILKHLIDKKETIPALNAVNEWLCNRQQTYRSRLILKHETLFEELIKETQPNEK